MNLQDIFKLVEQDFNAVNHGIFEQLHSEVPLVEQIGQYIIDSGGKRLRPLLVLLSTKSLQASVDQPTRLLAAVIEFLHTATLLHDDVVDTSDLRRGRPTANVNWGNAPSVLVGDFLYSRAFQMMVEIGSLEVMNILSQATCVIAEGEVMQLTNVRNPDITEAQYMQVIHGKTAMLFEASTHAAAQLASEDETAIQALKTYGSELGLAFQLIDDYLDYAGDAEALGKNLGDDLAEGKPTLPLIQAMAVGSSEQQQLIRQCIRKGGRDQIEEVLNVIEVTGALTYTQAKAQQHAAAALAALEPLAPSTAKEALMALAQIAVNRDR